MFFCVKPKITWTIAIELTTTKLNPLTTERQILAHENRASSCRWEYQVQTQDLKTYKHVSLNIEENTYTF